MSDGFSRNNKPDVFKWSNIMWVQRLPYLRGNGVLVLGPTLGPHDNTEYRCCEGIFEYRRGVYEDLSETERRGGHLDG